MMLRLEKATLGKFGPQDMMGLITSRGWESILPDALPDGHPNSPAYGHLKLPHLN